MRHLSIAILFMLIASLGSQNAYGFLEFHKEWVKMYIDETDKSEENQDYIKLVAKGKYRCLVCHQGKKKTNHNAYGTYFVGAIGKDDKKDTAKIIDTLTKVGKLPVDPDADPEVEGTLTYNDVIARKEFPGGPLEDLEQEPEDEATAGN